MKSINTDTFRIENAILSFPHLSEPQQYQGKGDPKFRVALLVDEATAGAVYAKAQELANKAFKNGEQAVPGFKWPVVAAKIKKGYAADPRTADRYVINANAGINFPPQKLDGTRLGPDNKFVVLQDTAEVQSRLYAGCIVAAGIRLYTYDGGVGCGFSAVMKTADGEPLGSEGVDAETLFEGVKTVQANPAASFPGGLPAVGGESEDPGASMPLPPFMQ